MTTELQTERHDTTLVLRLHGPATRNALSPQVYAAGVETLNMAEANPDVHAVVLTGAGGHFCGGGALQRLAHQRVHDMAAQARSLDAFHQWIEALHSFPKPVIAAVAGVAAGGGVSLALACDLIVAADNARFVMAYSQVGLSSDGGGGWPPPPAPGPPRARARGAAQRPARGPGCGVGGGAGRAPKSRARQLERAGQRSRSAAARPPGIGKTTIPGQPQPAGGRASHRGLPAKTDQEVIRRRPPPLSSAWPTPGTNLPPA